MCHYLVYVATLLIRLSTLVDAVNPQVPSPYYRVVGFDVSGVDRNSSTLVKAEFRIYRTPNPQARTSEQRVEIYQVQDQWGVFMEARLPQNIDKEKKH